MTGYIIRRFFFMIITFLVLSVLIYIVIQLPPGDYLTTYVAF